MSEIRQTEDGKRLYNIWRGMKRRCYDSNQPGYKNYGARGILVCEDWYNSFEKFYYWAINNGYRNDLTIDRIDNNGNYTPNNCRWVSWEGQANNRRNNVNITLNGETHTLSEWCKLKGLSYYTVQERIKCGMSYNEALRPLEVKNRYSSININGEIHSLSEWCKIKGLNYDAVLARIHRGYNVIDAIQVPFKEAVKYITIGNETHTLAEWCRIKGINYGTIYDRIRNGMKPATALNTPVKSKTENVIYIASDIEEKKNKSCKYITINGETHSIADWCRIKGLNYLTIKNRIRRGMSPLEALTMEYKKSTKDITINGETHSIADWCRIIGISRATYGGRVSRGMTPIEALTTPIHGKS